jgi:hypothetical protein
MLVEWRLHLGAGRKRRPRVLSSTSAKGNSKTTTPVGSRILNASE